MNERNKRYGYTMLGIWGKELKDNEGLLNKIIEFDKHKEL